MSRSLKKGPFVDDHLMKKVEALNESNDKKVVSKLGLVVLRFSLTSSVTQSLFMMVVNMCQYTVTEDMVGHKLGEFAPTRTYKGHAADDKKT